MDLVGACQYLRSIFCRSCFSPPTRRTARWIPDVGLFANNGPIGEQADALKSLRASIFFSAKGPQRWSVKKMALPCEWHCVRCPDQELEGLPECPAGPLSGQNQPLGR